MKKLRVPSVLLLVSALFSACREKPAAPAGGVRIEAVPVKVAPVAVVAWDHTVSIVGTLFPKDEAITAGLEDLRIALGW